MKQLSFNKRVCRAVSMLLCLAVLLSVPALAYERIDTGAEASLTAYFAEDGAGMENVAFRLYRVAEVSDTVEFTLTGAFADAPVSLDTVESAGAWTELAATLSAYADANGIQADAAGTTDADGRVAFSGLATGLYLLSGDTAVAGDYSYTPAPTIVMLPTLLDDDAWAYAPTVELKYTKTFLTETQDVTVKKVWSDGSRSGRPSSVKVQLLRDGQVQETVTLNAENNWTYTWSALTGTYEGSGGEKKTYTYAVNEESVPTGYTVSVGRSGDTFTVTNTYQTASTPDSTLPQTGSLNWPIPVLTVCGLLLAALGWYLLGRKKEN